MFDKNSYMREYRKTHKDPKRSIYVMRCKHKYKKAWEGFIPVETQCQVCGKDIYFNKGSSQNAICFDHRHGGMESIKNPSDWLGSHVRTSQNEKVWIACDFGMLCVICNHSLPTKDRQLFLSNITKYIKGEGKQ